MSSKNLIIVARYNENIEWSKALSGDIIIYNKGEDWPFENIPRINTENYGREGETFVRAIIEFYETFKNYDLISFVQGNPFDHCPDVISLINNNEKNELLTLSNSINRDIYNDNRRIFNIHPSIINSMLNLDHLNKEFIPEYQKLDLNTNLVTNQNPHQNWFLDNLTMCIILGIDHQDKDIHWGVGAQYSVPTCLIKNKSLEWWKNLHYLFYYLCKENNEIAWTYILERIWPLIWQHSDL